MIFDRGYLARSLAERLQHCSYDELRVIDRVLAGIELGREQYGPLDLSRDTRLFRREGAMELRDYLFYAAAHEVAIDDADRERRTDEFRKAVSDGLYELRVAEPVASAELALPRVATDELRLCTCSHPESLHGPAHCLMCDCFVFYPADGVPL